MTHLTRSNELALQIIQKLDEMDVLYAPLSRMDAEEYNRMTGTIAAMVSKALFSPTHVDIVMHEPVQLLTQDGGGTKPNVVIQYPDSKVTILSHKEFEQTFVYKPSWR